MFFLFLKKYFHNVPNFRSIVYKDVSLSDWLLDAHKVKKESGKCIFS